MFSNIRSGWVSAKESATFVLSLFLGAAVLSTVALALLLASAVNIWGRSDV